MNKPRKQTLLYCLLLLSISCINSLFGQATTLVIDNSYYQDSLDQWKVVNDYLSFQKDLSLDFNPTKNEFLDNWQTLSAQERPRWKNNIWLKLPIRNTTAEKIDLTLLMHADLLDVWYQDDRSNWQHQMGGNLQARSTWDSRQHQPEYLSPHTIQFSLSANRTTDLYIKIGLVDWNNSLRAQLCNRSFFINHSAHYFQRTMATQSFFHGILVIMMLFTFGMFLLNKDRAYLYYAAYAFSILMFLAYAFEFQNFTFLAEYPRLGRVLYNSSHYAFPFFYNLFLIHFLHAEGWQSKIKNWFRQFNKVLLIVGGLTTLALILLPPTIFKLQYAEACYFPLSIIGMLILVIISWEYWRSNNYLARFVAANNFFLFVGLLVSGLVFYLGSIGIFDMRNAGFWGILFLEATIVLQLLSFSLSLSYKGLETERERVKLKELDQLKSRFFANISHEFRTPLTLILGPVQQLKTKTENISDKEQLTIAEKYARSLLRLVNQILDLTKLEVGKMELEQQPFDWINMCKVITYSFESAAAQKDIKLQFQSQLDQLVVNFDQNKMEQVLINLLSNAIKFTPEGGKIELVSELIKKNKFIQLIVKDTGVGIPEAEQKYIFQHFYQADHGDFTSNQPSSGIGLALAKELVQLHDGIIYVESQRGSGTQFIIEIPIVPTEGDVDISSLQKTDRELAVQTLEKIEPAGSINQEDKPLILIVEDHPDIQAYIKSCLIDDYQLVLATDGEMGIQQAIESVPDLIITDVMMPKKDGFELTKILKEHDATSHIPIIILTGKSSRDSKITALKTTADDYLTKPFDTEELLLRVKNLLDNRQKWRQYFQQSVENPQASLNIPSIEDAFIQKALAVVEEALSDENFSVEKLGRALRLDRTQLFRKLKAITGQNPSNFIRTVRLKKAYTLLSNRTATVGEVAFSVGFSSTQYFSRCFKDQFGKTPGTVLNGS